MYINTDGVINSLSPSLPLTHTPDGNFGEINITLLHNNIDGTLWIFEFEIEREDLAGVLKSFYNCNDIIRNSAFHFKTTNYVSHDASSNTTEVISSNVYNPEKFRYKDVFYRTVSQSVYTERVWLIANCQVTNNTEMFIPDTGKEYSRYVYIV